MQNRNEPSFENRLLEGFAACGFAFDDSNIACKNNNAAVSALRCGGGQKFDAAEIKTFIIAVSGGADSIALLSAVSRLECFKGKKKITALTIDHGIRAESADDVRFVREYCKKLGVMCKAVSLGKGEVDKTAAARGMGQEEAARFLRYKAFETALDKTKNSVLCAAHTQDDNLETILMRFLQGSASAPLAGIPVCRGRIIRPMLRITRKDVLEYLELLGAKFRNDSTNDDISYLRNNIRHKLIPVLTENFSGWQKALLSGAEKNRDDAEVVSSRSEGIKWQKIGPQDAAFGLPLDTFFFQSRAVRRELVYQAWNELHRDEIGRRLPYETVSRVCDGRLPVNFDNTVFEKKSRDIVVKTLPHDGNLHEGGFFVLIEKEGTYEVSAFKIHVSKESSGVCARLPFCVRSVLPSDKICFADGEKSLPHLFSSAKIPQRMRHLIPVIETQSVPRIAAVMGSVLGYKDWISTEKTPAPFDAKDCVRITIEGAEYAST